MKLTPQQDAHIRDAYKDGGLEAVIEWFVLNLEDRFDDGYAEGMEDERDGCALYDDGVRAGKEEARLSLKAVLHGLL